MRWWWIGVGVLVVLLSMAVMARIGHPPTELRCPECRSLEVIPIVYGLPGTELTEQAERGEVALGGCILTGNDPAWHCTACEHRWGRTDMGR
jgi:hypothetical protein